MTTPEPNVAEQRGKMIKLLEYCLPRILRMATQLF